MGGRRSDRGIETVVEGFLEWQEGEHHVGGGLDLVNAAPTPGPDGGADMWTVLIPARRSFSSTPILKSGASTPTKMSGIGDEVAQQFAAYLEDAGQTAQHLGDAHDESSSISNSAFTPRACIRGPAIPSNCASG